MLSHKEVALLENIGRIMRYGLIGDSVNGIWLHDFKSLCLVQCLSFCLSIRM